MTSTQGDNNHRSASSNSSRNSESSSRRKQYRLEEKKKMEARKSQRNQSSQGQQEQQPEQEIREQPVARIEQTTTRIERLVDKIQAQKYRRLKVPRKAMRAFLEICTECAEKTPGPHNVIPFESLLELQHKYRKEDEDGNINIFRSMAHKYSKYDDDLYKVFSLAVSKCREYNENVFLFHEFYEYDLVKQKPFLKEHRIIGACFGVVLYYFFSAILFCAIMGNNSTCPYEDGDYSWGGWGTAIYFASSTISTVGYGDVSVVGSGTEFWRMLIGTLYMIIAMVVAVTVFSALSTWASEHTGMTDSSSITSPILRPMLQPLIDNSKDKPIKYQMQTMRRIRVAELTYYFVLLNTIGMLFARFIFAVGEEEVDWSWMTTFYWAVQTTTTIGYGDLTMPFELRWFNLFFTIIGTAFAASVLSSLSSLSQDLQDLQKFYAWKNREVSARLIAEMDGDEEDADGENDNNLNMKEIDEYEFLVGSLIMLDKIKKEDVIEIMDKFRELAGADNRITKEDIERHNIGIFRTASSMVRTKSEAGFWNNMPSTSDFFAAATRNVPAISTSGRGFPSLQRTKSNDSGVEVQLDTVQE